MRSVRGQLVVVVVVVVVAVAAAAREGRAKWALSTPSFSVKGGYTYSRYGAPCESNRYLSLIRGQAVTTLPLLE